MPHTTPHTQTTTVINFGSERATRKNPGTHSLLGKIQINLNKRKAGPAQRQRRTCCAQLANKFSRMSSAGIVLRPPLSPRRRRSDLHDFFFFGKNQKFPKNIRHWGTIGCAEALHTLWTLKKHLFPLPRPRARGSPY